MEESDYMIDKQLISDFLDKYHVDGLFVQKDENIRYISGFTGSDSYLFVTHKEYFLITDSRYTEQAGIEAKGFTVINHSGLLIKTLTELAKKNDIRTLGIERVFSYEMYLNFIKEMQDTVLTFCPVDDLRRIKSDEEIRYLSEACRISDIGFKNMLPYVKEGVTEKYLMRVLECEMLKAGSEGKSFDTIVASGERGAYPHGTATDKVIRNGELITFDFGAVYNGYHSDITRTIAVGTINERQRFLYDKVLGCNEYIESILKAGMRADQIDEKSREYLKQFDLDSYFTHALGHSVGLEIHESPVLAHRDKSVLEENMTETVEPGVYIPGIGGVRIEDTVVIKQDGISILTLFPKKFLSV